MIIGIGCDLVRVARFESWEGNIGKLERFFHPDEVRYCRSQESGAAASLAARFAAREAFAKALGCGLGAFALADAWVTPDADGRPVLMLRSAARTALERSGGTKVHLSLAHERDYAMATVVVES